MNKNKKTPTVVIAGGGYAGLNTAIGLAKRNRDLEIILIDRQDYHLYYPNIYEVASSEEEFVTIQQLKKSLVIPFKEVLPKSVKFIKGNVDKISQKENYISVDGKGIDFDYAVVALGAAVDFFGIPGVQENAVTMKSVPDALKIKNAIEFLVQSHRQDTVKKLLRIVIAGGGFTGVELAGELTSLLEILSFKNGYPLDRLQIEIIEGAGQLLPGMPSVVSNTVYYRLKNFGVNILLNSMVTAVSPKQITLNNGEMVNYDLLIWTGGVKSATAPFETEAKKDRKGRNMADEDLTLSGYNNIYVIGDNACIMDPNKNPMPQTATQAIMHSDYVVAALTAKLQGKKPFMYRTEASPYIIPVRGKWGIMHLPNGFTMTGFIPWVLKTFANIRYFNRLMPLMDAIRLAWFETKLYTRND